MSDLILCAVDGSDAMGRVLDTGRWLADALVERLVVLSVTSGRTADADADEMILAVRAHLGDASAEVRVVEGDPAPTIRTVAAEDEPELLVLGSRGHGALRSALLGSVSREVAAGTRLPVVVVPSGQSSSTDVRENESVICGVDGSDASLAAVALGGELATRLGLRLVIVHARQNLRAAVAYPGARSSTPPVTGQEDSVAGLVEVLVQRAQEVAGAGATSIVEAGPPAEVLETVAQRENGRLIVIATRGTGGVRSAILGSVATELAANATRPVLVLSEAAAAAVADGHPMLTGA
jgi:nucleotide-binding universal stress UspA family protein